MHMAKWSEAKALPGANRLIRHLHKHNVPLALASNSLVDYVEAKISYHKGWKDCFSAIIGSDQVKQGKPAPYLFEEAAKRIGVSADDCLVVEDSLIGVKAAKAAQMKVVVVPSSSEADAAFVADSSLLSLLDFQPELWGLPPFDDWVDKALSVDHIHLKGLYRDGFLVSGFTQMTVNNQIAVGTLMNLSDNPTRVSVGQNWRDSDTTHRVPIIMTGNDLSTIYAPLIRDGRMEKSY